MTTIGTTAMPEELFCELIDIGGLAIAMLTGANVQIKRWPPFYLVYLEVDRLYWETDRAASYLAHPFVESDGKIDRDRIDEANACFSQIGKHFRTIVNLLGHIDRHDLASPEEPAVKRIAYNHFSPKSAWMFACQKQYCPGRVSPDGQRLERTALLLDHHPVYRVNDIDDKYLIRPQAFDLLSEKTRSDLYQVGGLVQRRLGKIGSTLGDFFVSRCPSVRELLHPSMI